MKKLISIVIPTYNEEGNVDAMTDTLTQIMHDELPEYDYEIIYIDNLSKDSTRDRIRAQCEEDRHVKAIFNAKNFGTVRSPVYGLKQAYGDCVIRLNADFQDPPALIPEMVRQWEAGYKLVIGVKNKSKEKLVMKAARKIYYWFLGKVSEVGHIKNFTGFGLYDKDFVDIVRSIHDPAPYFRGMVAEFGYKIKPVYYDRPERRSGKSSYSFYSMYDFAMLGVTSYSKFVMRMATFAGAVIGMLSFAVALVYLVLKLIHWDWFRSGIAPLTFGVFFLGGVQLFFIGLLGEYILSINSRVLDRPLVVEEERLSILKMVPRGGA